MSKGRQEKNHFWDSGPLTSSDVQVAGNLAVGVGTVQAGAMKYEGKYLVVWKKQEDGSWKLYRDMWSSNLMPAEEEEPEGEPRHEV